MFKTYVPVLAFAALALGGCGGDEDSSSAEKTPAAQTRLTQAEYVAQANKICKDTEDAQKEFDDKMDKIDRGDLEGAAPIIEGAVKTTRTGYDRLKALSPPAADEARVGAYLTAVDQQLESRDRLVEALRDDDRAAARKAADDGDRLGEASRRLGNGLSLDDCSNTF
jgi:hypothetical protein